MPVKIPDALPATKVLQEENIFVMTEQRATAQDIRPLRIAILNLMPTKEITETQLLRLIGNTPLQIEVTLLNTATHKSKNTSSEHLGAFYKHFKEVRHEKFDGLIITGAPIELMEFEQVNYWAELLEVMEWADHNVFSTMYICWAAQAAFHHFYGIDKYKLGGKMFGVFSHEVLERTCKLTRGFDDWFYAPHSRHTGIDVEDVRRCPDLTLLAVSPEAGLYLAQSKNGRRVFVTGHSEYDFDTLDKEYKRDVAKNLPINIPCNYYPGDDPSLPPRVCWRAHSNLLFGNWLNYYVYQETPYDLEAIE